MNMMKVCGKIPSEARLEKNCCTSVNEYLLFREIWKIPCVVQIFSCVLPKLPVFLLSGKIDNQVARFPPCAVATLIPLILVRCHDVAR